MSVKFKELGMVDGEPVVVSEVTHSTEGRNGTTLSNDLVIRIHPGSCQAEMTIMAEGDIPTLAIEKLIEYLGRMKEGLEKMDVAKVSLPLWIK